MKRVLVTGAAGFVGANLTRRLLVMGHQVHLLGTELGGAWRLQGICKDLTLHEVDLRDAEQVRQAVRIARPDWIFHLAVHGAYSWQTDPRTILETNVLGTAHLVEACRKVGFEMFVNTGSSSEYGRKNHAPSEDAWLEPNSCYAVSKAAATLYCRSTARKTGLAIPTIRLYSVYGPYEDPSRFVPALVLRGLAGTYPPLADPATARDFVHIDDVVEAYLRVAGKQPEDPGAVYNVGTGTQTTLGRMVEFSRRLFGIVGQPRWNSMPPRGWDTSVWVADIRRIQNELGWQPRYTPEEGLRSLAEWFREHPTLQARYWAILNRRAAG